MRVMGLDFGSKTVGVAVSDPLLVTAQGVETVFRKSPDKLRQTLARIKELAQEYEVGRIVLGYPKHMNNTEGERCEKTKAFARMLEHRTGLTVELWDERLTTAAANYAMMESGVRREERKAYVDKIAACLILQGYLDRLHSQQAEKPAAEGKEITNQSMKKYNESQVTGPAGKAAAVTTQAEREKNG